MCPGAPKVNPMLAEYLSQHREIVRDVEARAALLEGASAPARERRERLGAMFEQLIDMLRRGGTEDGSRERPRLADGALELEERELIWRSLLEQVEQGRIDVPLKEVLTLSDW